MRLEVVNTGTELLLGKVVNTHAAYFGQELFKLGLRVQRQTTIPDGDEIRTVLAEAFPRCDVILITGGLGPTSDDITREVVAEMLGRSDLAGAVAGSDPGKNLLVVSERHGEPNQPVAVSIGTVDGQTARLEGVVVRPEDQGQGIGRRSLLAWCSAAADRGADAVVASLRLDNDELPWRGLLEGCGFGITGDLAIRRP